MNVCEGTSLITQLKLGNDRIPPPPYKVPNLHPHKYYKTGSSEGIDSQPSKILFDKEAERDPLPLVRFR